ncbi:CopG family transcriptional regulator [Lysinibacillus sp. G4S2]|uniref:CopG family transcriptional regulator n=1 Tax=Lysinibacillus sp. G4S2 TaxID=3055859 RepID=UPI0025A0BB95|nr:CopG family transcriptional regulator [Lysinibacillus sp. G4S2]MDM5245744.1 CopG family transcriptional regulator [Lysinibacillus sp. G4S2]
MNELLKMTKPKLKELYIQKLKEIESLLGLLEEQSIPVTTELIINSNYLESRSYKDPDEFGHKVMKKENYALDIEKFQSLIDALEKLKQEYEIGNQNQNGDKDLEKSNLIQTENEKSNLNQRGGKRKGAGRKAFGITKKVSLTLSEETWSEIGVLIGNGSNQSEVLRSLIEKGLKS